MKLIAATFVMGTVLAFAAHGAEIYRWTDESGKTHISDTVPAKYKDTASRIDSKAFELSPEQRGDAEARAAAQKALATAQMPPSPTNSAAPLPAPASLSPSPPASGPASAKNSCEAQWRVFRESLDCFAPFMDVNGSLRPGAFDVCRRSVVQPACDAPPEY
jgi:Domain of unknown function (DUF4124)